MSTLLEFLKTMSPDDMQFSMLPDLPSVKFEKNKTKYEVTDLRYLNQHAIMIFTEMLGRVIDNPNLSEFSVDVSAVDDDTIHIITDILMAMNIRYRKGGKHGYCGQCNFLVRGVRRETTDDTITAIFFLEEDHARWVHEYAQNYKGDNYDYYDIAAYIADRCRDAFKGGVIV